MFAFCTVNKNIFSLVKLKSAISNSQLTVQASSIAATWAKRNSLTESRRLLSQKVWAFWKIPKDSHNNLNCLKSTDTKRKCEGNFLEAKMRKTMVTSCARELSWLKLLAARDHANIYSISSSFFACLRSNISEEKAFAEVFSEWSLAPLATPLRIGLIFIVTARNTRTIRLVYLRLGARTLHTAIKIRLKSIWRRSVIT